MLCCPSLGLGWFSADLATLAILYILEGVGYLVSYKVGVLVGLQGSVLVGLQRSPNWSPTTSFLLGSFLMGTRSSISDRPLTQACNVIEQLGNLISTWNNA